MPLKISPLAVSTAALAATTAAITFHLWRRAVAAEAEAKALREDAATALPAMPLLPISSLATISMCKELKLRDDDVFICSYPKSGTTWMQHIVTTLLTRGAHPAEGEHISEFSPFFEIDRHWDAASREPKAGERGPAALGRRVFNTCVDGRDYVRLTTLLCHELRRPGWLASRTVRDSACSF